MVFLNKYISFSVLLNPTSDFALIVYSKLHQWILIGFLICFVHSGFLCYTSHPAALCESWHGSRAVSLFSALIKESTFFPFFEDVEKATCEGGGEQEQIEV